MKYRTNKQLDDRTSMLHSQNDAVTKYSCYSAVCSSHNAADTACPCYSPLCKRAQEQAYSCKVHLSEKLQRDLCRLRDGVHSHDDETIANKSLVDGDSTAGSNLALDSKFEGRIKDASNGCICVEAVVEKQQSDNSVCSNETTRRRDMTAELRSLTSLLQRHVVNSQIHLTDLVVSRLQSLLDKPTDTRNRVCLSGTVRKSCLKRTEIPVAHDFRTRSCRRSVFVLATSTLKRLARSAGMLFTIPGFSSCVSTKADSGWIYTSPRPLFCTSWQYRTASARNLSAIALQLRVLWCSIRWDDMSTDSSATEATTVNIETNTVTTTTILRRRDVGQDGLRSEYLVQRVSAPVAAGDDWHGNCTTTNYFANKLVTAEFGLNVSNKMPDKFFMGKTSQNYGVSLPPSQAGIRFTYPGWKAELT